MLLPSAIWAETVTVEKYLGSSAHDDVFDDPREWPARVRYGSKLVRDRGGSEVVSTSTVMLPAETHEHITLGSRVKLPHDDNKRIALSGGPVMGLREISHVVYDLE